MPEFNRDMLRLGRDARAYTQQELAERADVTQALISKLEHGLIQPSADVLASIAGALDFPVSFFTQPERAIGFPAFHYRKRVRLGTGALNRIDASINIRRLHIAKLLRSYEREIGKPIPEIDLDHSGLTPEKVAERLRAYWMLPRGPVADLVDLIESAGGVVVLTRFDTDLLDALSFRSEGLPPLFFMNKDVPPDRFRFSLAHELGHIVMHTIPGDDQKMEREADRFAAAFLMPANDIRPYLSDVKLTNLSRVKAFWKVSIKALIKRAFDLKLITKHWYKVLNIQYNKSFSQGEPVPLEPEQPAVIPNAVRFHLEALAYSAPELAALLCLSETDLRLAYVGSPRLRLVKT